MATEGSADVVVVGASHHALTTDARAALVALDDGGASPTHDLVKGGHARAVLRVATCARVEWIVVADNPAWSATLLEAACTKRAGVRGLHRHEGDAALDYLFSVTLGLDSVVEGEAAIGRQVLAAFQAAHEEKPLDPTLRRLWHAVSALVSEKRRALATQYAGVERLVAERISRGPVAIFGRGDIAKAIEEALSARGVAVEGLYGRDRVEAFATAAATVPAVVVAAAAHEAWLTLPERADHPLCIDVSSPIQVKDRGGFELVTLDALFSSGGAKLASDVHALLVELKQAAIAAYRRPDPTTPAILAELMRHKAKLLEERLPRALEGVEDPELKKRLRAEVQSFSHEMITTVRKGSKP